jgi:cellulose synthase/poly-beta-1,6-N-acetylglucosamine synthase-like glycosyltransferase
MLDQSVNRLRTTAPEMSAYRILSRGQTRLLLVVVALLVGAIAVRPVPVVIALNAIATLLYVAGLGYRLYLGRQALEQTRLVEVGDEEARDLPDHSLPIYTVLVPAYHEAGVIGHTIAALDQLDYPHDRLDVKLLLEEDDTATIAAAIAAAPGPQVEIVRVPAAQPKTKPKACNYGLALARGDLVTIFDAEDRPEPLQLRRAVAAFSRLDPSVACLQAQLSYRNTEQNLITRWFTIEYATWFAMLLPALALRGGPVPLGGTSMHIKREILEAVGAWDPHNVTEDADLGIRLARMGYGTMVLDSTTDEEANSDFVNWVKQRSRWYKGYLQTWLVHMRHPIQLFRELGAEPFLAFNLVVGVTPLVALLNPIFWFLTLLWFVAKLEFVQTVFPAWIYYPGLFCLVIGNVLALYLSLIAIRATGHEKLVGAVLLSPVYWLMMSIAALKAFIQLTIAPWFWEKTTHGLDSRPDTEVERVGTT